MAIAEIPTRLGTQQKRNFLLSCLKVPKEDVDSENPEIGRIQYPQALKSNVRIPKNSKRCINEIENTQQNEIDSEQFRSIYRYKQKQRVTDGNEYDMKL